MLQYVTGERAGERAGGRTGERTGERAGGRAGERAGEQTVSAVWRAVGGFGAYRALKPLS